MNPLISSAFATSVATLSVLSAPVTETVVLYFMNGAGLRSVVELVS